MGQAILILVVDVINEEASIDISYAISVDYRILDHPKSL